MSNINFQNRDINASFDDISQVVAKTARGAERVMEYISGLYDSLVMWDDALEYWQGKTFNFRKNEIEHLKSLGQLSYEEEAAMWKELMNEHDYGWKNVMVAEENYYEALYNHSKKWIEDQTRLGNLSADEVAAAWQRVFDKFDNINVKYQAALNMRDVLLSEADSETAARRADSDRWMARQDIYDGGDPARQIEDLTRRIETEKELLLQIANGVLNGVELGVEEQNQRWLECYEYIEDLEDQRYLAAKELLQQHIDDYIALQKSAVDETYEYRLGKYNSELLEIAQKRSDYEYSKKEENWDEELERLYILRDRYKYAVTDEGQEKYREYLDRIKEIEQEQEDYEYKKELDEEEKYLKEKIESLKDEYEQAKSELEETKNQLLNNTSLYLAENVSEVTAAGVGISGGLLAINQTFTTETTKLFKSCEAEIKSLIQSISNMLLTGLSGGTTSSSSDYAITFNDYGDKSFASDYSMYNICDIITENLKKALRATGTR